MITLVQRKNSSSGLLFSNLDKEETMPKIALGHGRSAITFSKNL